MSFKLQGRLPYLLLVVAILALDRWTKLLIQSRFAINESISIIDGFFDITYVTNTGVAFGIFSSISSPAKSLLLSLFTACAAVVVVTYSVRSSVQNRLLQFALALILGGALETFTIDWRMDTSLTSWSCISAVTIGPLLTSPTQP